MVDIDLARPDKMFQGYLFWHLADELATDVVNFAMLLDTEGKVMHRWDSDLDGGGHTSYLLPSGGLLRTGIKDRSYAPMNAVRQHLNALDYHPGLDQIVVSSFIYSEIWIIDHGTSIEEASGSIGGRRGRGGDLLFRHGNPAAYGRGTGKDSLFRSQHDANWVDEGLPGAGNILVFNNNTDTSGIARVGAGGAAAAVAQQQLKGMSNVHEFKPTLDDEGHYVSGESGTYEAKRVWFWEDGGFFAPFQGGARRLPNGNTLLTDTVGRRVWEVAADGEVVARYKGSAPNFKAFKFSAEQVAKLLD